MKKLKRLIALLMAVLMTFSLFTATALADGESGEKTSATITVGSIAEAVNPGTEISIPVTIADNPGFAGALLDVTYDSEVLEAADPLFVAGSALSGQEDMTLVAKTHANFSSSLNNFTANGEILTLHFTVKEGVTAKTTSVSIKLHDDDEDNFSDINGTAVPVEFVAGTVAINGIDLGPECAFFKTWDVYYNWDDEKTDEENIQAYIEANPDCKYDTIGEAMATNAASSGYTLWVLRDIDETTVTTGRADDFNLNGHTINTLNLVYPESGWTGTTYIGYGSYGTANDDCILCNGTINNLNVDGTHAQSPLKAYLSIGTNIKIGKLTINNGSFNVKGNDTTIIDELDCTTASNPSIGGGKYGTITFKGGSNPLNISSGYVNTLNVASGTASISGGIFDFDPTAYLNTSTDAKNGYHYETQKINDTQWTVVKVNAARFVVNGVNYDTFSNAQTAAGNGGTVVLGDAYQTSTDYRFGIAISKSITLDLNGHSVAYPITLSGKGINATIINNGAAATIYNGYAATSSSSYYTIKTFSTSGNSTLTIDGSNITLKPGTKLLFGPYSDSSYYYQKTADVVIKNAIVDCDADKLGYFKTFTVKGGSYNFDPSTVAGLTVTGCVLDDTLSSGQYKVVEHNNWSDVTWEWTGTTAAKVSHTCNTCSASYSANATITSSITTPATCISKGTTTYTAKAVLNGTEYTDTKTAVDIPVIDHSYGEVTYKWNANHTSCTATRTCTTQGCEDTQTAEGTVTSVVSQPTPCTEVGDTTYTATFAEEWAENQTETVTGNVGVKGHQYGEVTYEWSEDAKTCTAKHTCTVEGCGYEETATATITSEVKTPATCTENGTTTYTATFAESWAAPQTMDVQDIPAGHIYGPTQYNWSSDNLSCTASRTCTVGTCRHREDAVGTVTSVTKQAATCESKGITTYTATFAEEWAETQTKDVEDINALGHSYGEPTWTWAEDGKSAYATFVCANDDSHVEKIDATMTSNVTQTRSCSTPEITKYTASVRFEDKKYTADNEIQTAECLPHTVVIDPAVPATKTETGLTEGSHCSVCKAVIVPQAIIPVVPSEDQDKAQINVTVEEGTKEVLANISEKAFAQESEGGETKPVDIKIDNFGELSFDSEGAEAVAANAGNNSIQLSIKKEATEDKQSVIEAAGIEGATQVISVEMKAGGEDVFSSDTAEGNATLTIPYTPAEGKTIIIYLAKATGREFVPSSYADGKLTIFFKHFSDYVCTEHTLTHVTAEAATCETDGNIEYWYCADCGKYFSDAVGTTEISQEDTIIKKLGHNYSDHVCTRCGAVDENVKFYLGVSSKNTVDAVVTDDYNAVLRLPEDGVVSTDSVTVKAIMQNVASLGVSGIRQHSITVNTGLGSRDVDLKTWLKNAYDFSGAKIVAAIDGNKVTYALGKTTENKIYATTDEEAARTAWQSLTSHVSTRTQESDDSYIIIANGSYLMIGEEYLRFEDGYDGNLKLDNFSDVDGLIQAVRDAVYLDSCADQGGVITMFVKKGTELAVGSSVAVLDDDYMIRVTLDADELAALGTPLATLRDTEGKTEMVKALIKLVNNVIGVVDATETVKVDMHVHEMTYTAAQAATCEEDGNTEYWYCEGCGRYFSDAEGMNEISYEDTVIEKLGHDYSDAPEWFWSGDCNAKAEFTCSREGCDHKISVDASVEKEEIKKATCLESGEIKYTAKVTMGKDEYTDEIQVYKPAATGHDVEAFAANAPSCESAGNSAYWYCKNCKKYFSDEECTAEIEKDSWIISATGHKYGESGTWQWAEDYSSASIELSCTNEGCNHKQTFQAEVGKPVVTKEATCTEAGETTYTATVKVNGTTYTDTQVDKTAPAALDHKKVKTEAVAATCDKDGNIAYWYCSQCKKYFSDEACTEEITLEDTVIEALGHKYEGDGEWTWTEGYEATFEIECSRENCEHIEKVAATVKSYVTKEATCLAAGETTYVATANVDGKLYSNVKVDSTKPVKIAHSTVKTDAHEATCEGAGNIDYWYCSQCMKYYSDEACTKEIKLEDTVIPATGHDYTEVQPVWTWTGFTATASFGCTKCDHAEVMDAEITSKVTKNATCTEAGETTYTATVKFEGETYTDTQVDKTAPAALDHKKVKTEAVAATCDKDGNIAYWYCSQCKKYFSDEACTKEITLEDTVIPATGHKYAETGKWQWADDYSRANIELSCTNEGCSHKQLFKAEVGEPQLTKNPTCTEAGETTYTATVKVGEVTYTDTQVDKTAPAKLGHKMTAHKANAATCEEAGNSAYWYCSQCEKYFSDEEGTTEIEEDSWIIPATGHDYTGVRPVWIWTGFTATASFDCTQCDHTEVKAAEITSKVTKNATCTEAGETTYTATVEFEGETYTDTKVDKTAPAALNHKKEKTSAVTPTCDEAGNIEYWYCCQCDKYFSNEACTKEIKFEDTVLEALGHQYEGEGKWTWNADHTATFEIECTRANCEHIEYVEGDEVTIKSYVTKQATCTEPGTTLYIAFAKVNEIMYTDSKLDENSPAVQAHKLTAVKARKATCEENGNIAYWYCSTCNKYFSDAKATKQITQKSTVIKATGHKWSDHVCTVCKEKQLVSAPKLKSISSTQTGITLTWGKVTDASKYQILRKAAGDSSWTKKFTTKSTSYTDTTAEHGIIYTYTVRVLNGSGVVISKYKSSGLKSVILDATVKIAAKAYTGYNRIAWRAVKGATGYRVYRKAAGETTYQKIKTIFGSDVTRYKDSYSKKGVKYTYIVKAFAKVGGNTIWSPASKGVTVTTKK